MCGCCVTKEQGQAGQISFASSDPKLMKDHKEQKAASKIQKEYRNYSAKKARKGDGDDKLFWEYVNTKLSTHDNQITIV